MLEIKQLEFFGTDIMIRDDYVSINLMIDPEKFGLKAYKRTPFASFIIKDETLVYKIIATPEKDHKQIVLSAIHNHSMMYPIHEYNLYVDDEYSELTSKYADRLFHSIIYYMDISEEKIETDTSSILVAAIPVRGIISPIGKSYLYTLYNGVFINCKPFPIGNEFYNKIIYILADVKSTLQINEFVNTSSDIYGYMYSHIWNCMYNPDDKITNFDYKCIINRIPYDKRESLFTKPSKNIFYLSDVPKDIMAHTDSFSVKL